MDYWKAFRMGGKGLLGTFMFLYEAMDGGRIIHSCRDDPWWSLWIVCVSGDVEVGHTYEMLRGFCDQRCRSRPYL